MKRRPFKKGSKFKRASSWGLSPIQFSIGSAFSVYWSKGVRWAFKERRACVRSARSVCGVCVLRGVRRRCERVSGGGGGYVRGASAEGGRSCGGGECK